MLPTWPNDTPFRGKDCRESILASGSRVALHAEARVEGIVGDLSGSGHGGSGDILGEDDGRVERLRVHLPVAWPSMYHGRI